MDVTKHNFKSLLPEIEESINKSSFICIDGEFTGKREHSEVKGLYQFLYRVTKKGREFNDKLKLGKFGQSIG